MQYYLWHKRRSIALIAVGLIIGGVAGSVVFDRVSRSLSPAELTEIWEKYRPTTISDREANRSPKGWEYHHRSAPDDRRQPSAPPAPSRQLEVSESAIRFSVCSSSSRINCVVDGDTIWYRGNKIRIADIDTPEISTPKCPSEEALGHRAKHRLLELLNDGPFQVVRAGRRDKDRYGRLLRVIMRDGQSLGTILVNEGLAHVWEGRKRPWC